MQHARDDEPRPTQAEPAEHTGAVRRERFLPGSTDDAWHLLRDADGLECWLADDVDLVVAPGEFGTFRDGDQELAVVVDEVDEGRRLSLRWWPEDGDPSVVDLTLDDVDGRTRLVVTEIPLRLVAAPSTVPAEWSASGAGPQACALACV